MVKARQIVSILDDEQDTNCDVDHDPPCPESTLPTPDVVCLPCRDPSISLYGCLSWSPCCTCHHWQRSNWKYDPSLTRNTLDVQLYQVLSPSSSQMALLSFRWSKRYEESSPLTSQTTFEGLVVEDLDVEVLAGTPFTERERERERVLLGNGSIYTYGSKAPPSPLTTVRRAFVFRASNPSKDCLALRIPGSTAPRRRSPWFRVCTWAPYWCTYFTKSQALPAVVTIQCRFQCCARNTHTKPVNRASNA